MFGRLGKGGCVGALTFAVHGLVVAREEAVAGVEERHGDGGVDLGDVRGELCVGGVVSGTLDMRVGR